MKRPGGDKVFSHVCVGCGRHYPDALTPFCECGHFIDVTYDLPRCKLHVSDNPYLRYFDLLPVRDRDSLPCVTHAATPCLRAKALGHALNLPNLYLKNETVLPTRSTKDRMAVVSLAYMHENGVRDFSAASTGNTSTAFGHWIRHHPDMKVTLFCAEDFLSRLQVDPDSTQITVVALRGASFVEACDASREFASRRGLYGERGFFNPARREGLKTAFLEAAETIPTPIDWYAQAVSSGMGVYGAYKGAKELLALGALRQLPRLLCVQQQSNHPMVAAFQAGSPVIRPQDIVLRPEGIAQGILRGDPSRVYPYVRRIVLESRGTMVVVTEQEIRDAQKMVEEFEGIRICFNAAACMAGVIYAARRGHIPSADTVMVNLTGGDRDPVRPRHVNWLQRTGSGWEPENKTGSILENTGSDHAANNS